MNHIQSNFSDYMLWKIFLRGVRLGNFWKNFFSLSVLFLFLCCCCCLFFFPFLSFLFFFVVVVVALFFVCFFCLFFFFLALIAKWKFVKLAKIVFSFKPDPYMGPVASLRKCTIWILRQKWATGNSLTYPNFYWNFPWNVITLKPCKVKLW